MIRQATFRTIVPADRQVFLDHRAAGTGLACISRIDFYQLTPGTLSLVREFMKEAAPRSIVNLLRENAARHPLDVQLLDSDKVEFIDQMPRKFVLKIRSLIENLLMDRPQNGNSFTPAVRAFLSSGNAPLGDAQFLGGRCVVFPVFDLRTVRESGEVLDANINAGVVAGVGQWIGRDFCTGGNCVPLDPFTFDDHLFDRAFNGSVQFDFDQPNVGQSEFIAEKSKPLAVIDKAIEKVCTFEAWVARFIARFDAPKEGLEGSIYLPQYFSTDSRLDVAIFRAKLANLGNLPALLIKRNIYPIEVPSVPSLLKRGVIEFTTQIKRALQFCYLLTVGVQSEFVGFAHHYCRLIIA